MAENRKHVGLRLSDSDYQSLRLFAFRHQVSLAEAARQIVSKSLAFWTGQAAPAHADQESAEE